MYLLLALAYLMGSLPAGVWVARRFGVDLRQRGSGNTGATNVLRTLGWKPALFVFLLDFSKGALPMLLARVFGVNGLLLAAIALAAVLGHDYSIFLGFRGGKGVATSLGAMLVLDPWIACSALLIGLIVIALTHLVSAGSLVGFASALILACLLGRPWPELTALLVLTIMVFWTHRANLVRLQRGVERRLGDRE
jgi:glycerol-3-phosphate acyltransferase PlsY